MESTTKGKLPQEGNSTANDNLGITQSSGLDHHAVFSRQRVDLFLENEVASTESARQHKDATDLVMQRSNDEHIHTSQNTKLIRRLSSLECERLQGFPDGWTNIPSASDSARYKALGNSVAIPCVEYVLQGIALVLQNHRRRRENIVIMATAGVLKSNTPAVILSIKILSIGGDSMTQQNALSRRQFKASPFKAADYSLICNPENMRQPSTTCDGAKGRS